MALTPRALFTALLVSFGSGAAQAQATEDFEAGNPDNWHMDFNGSINGTPVMEQQGTHQPMGGNPGGMLEFLGLQGNFEYWALQANPGTAGWNGNLRAAGVNELSFDTNHLQGMAPFGMHFYVLLADDMGTTELFDDILVFSQFDPMTYSFAGFGAAVQSGVWTNLSWTFDTSSSTLPPGWQVHSYGGTNSGNDDADWDAVIQDVDYIAIINTNPGGGFALGTIDILFDNIELKVGSLGTPYCVANPNSSGSTASILATGSSLASDQSLTLTTNGVVPGVPGLYFFGTSQVQVPFGDGFRCAGGQTTRIQPPQNANPLGVTTRALNFAAPYGSALVSGADLNYQLWYRDPMAGMAGFNLSNGLNLIFQ